VRQRINLRYILDEAIRMQSRPPDNPQYTHLRMPPHKNVTLSVF